MGGWENKKRILYRYEESSCVSIFLVLSTLLNQLDGIGLYPMILPRRKDRGETLWVYGKPDGGILEEICTREGHVLPITILSVFMLRLADAGMRNLTSRRRSKRQNSTAIQFFFFLNTCVFPNRVILYILSFHSRYVLCNKNEWKLASMWLKDGKYRAFK